MVGVVGEAWPSTDAPLIDHSRTGCQSPPADQQRLSVSAKVSPLCLLIGNNLTHRPLSSKCRFTKGVEQAPVKYGVMHAVWIC